MEQISQESAIDSPRKRFLVFAVFALGYFLSYFFRSANAVIAPDLMNDLALLPADLGLMTSFFFGAFALMQIPLGPLLDRFGARVVTPLFMMIGAIGSIIFSRADSFILLSIGRALLGIGMSGILMGGFKTFSTYFSNRRYATATSLMMAIGSSGALLAATPMALVKAEIGWRGIFLWGAAGIGFVAALIAILAKRGTIQNDKSSASAGSYRDILFDHRFWRIAFIYLAQIGALFAMQSLWAGPFLYNVKNLAAIEVGNILILISVGSVTGYALAGPLADRFGLPQVLISGTSALCLAFALLATIGNSAPQGMIAAIYFAIGFGGAFSTLPLSSARIIFPTALTGRAITAINCIGLSSVFLFQWMMGIIIGSFKNDPAMGFRLAFMALALVIAISIILYKPMLAKEE